ncbi:MAG: NmrA/HSCARG family protein [Chitinophagaceae bacterium]|nr:NmrA/HSCARG family protein [Chitinophagaceae bacterium]
MQNDKTIFVTGATGNQGGAVVRNLVSKGFRVKALIRNPGKPGSKSITGENVEIIKGDLNDSSSYRNYLQNADGVFCNLQFTAGVDKEIQQGLNLATISREQGVKHFVYSSVVGCDLNTGIPHWESKNLIENYIKSTGLNYTILRPASLYENLLMPQVKSRILKGKLVLPTRADKIQQFIGSQDIGRISTMIFADPLKYSGRTLTLASEQMNGNQLARVFSTVLNREIKFQQLPMFITRLVMGSGLAKMFRWINNNEALFMSEMESLKKEFPGMLSIEKWIENNFK